jgi:hypothetical protein
VTDYPIETLLTPEVVEALAHLAAMTRGWRRDEERAAATLTINLTTTPFDVRERALAALLRLAGVGPERWNAPLAAPGRDIVPARPRDAFLQLIDRERTYLSNVPVETPIARVCRALVRLGVLSRLPTAATLDGLAEALSGPGANLDASMSRPYK